MRKYILIVVFVLLPLAALAQERMDPATVLETMGMLTYQNTVLQAQLQAAHKMIQDRAAYWAKYVDHSPQPAVQAPAKK